MKHTALPWKYEGPCYTDNGGKYLSIITEDCANEVLDEYGVNEADAEFIVKACNSHYELLEALTEIHEAAKKLDANWHASPTIDLMNLGLAAKAAIEKAK